MLAGHIDQFTCINWRNPGLYSLSRINSPTFTTDRGWNSDGTTSYLSTGYNPSVGGLRFTQNDASMGVWCLTDGASSSIPFGAANVTASWIFPRSASDTFGHRFSQASSTNIANTDARGFFSANRTGSSATEGFKNGASGGTGSVASSSIQNAAFYVLAYNASPTPIGYETRRIGLVFAGASLTAAQHSKMYSIFGDYMRTIGAI
jgi:hypothetical protein